LAEVLAHVPIALLDSEERCPCVGVPPAAHAVADTEADMRALILGALAADEESASFLLPTRQTSLFRWCLAEGLHVVKPMTYMAIGEYREPSGWWIPSVLY
jgi:hypothetical protein